MTSLAAGPRQTSRRTTRTTSRDRAGRLAVARLPRDLHPVAWWVWAIGLAVGASATTNPLLLGTLLAVVTLVVSARRSAQPWGRSFRLYVWLGVVIVVMRVAFGVLVGSSYGGRVLVRLPEVPLPDWVLGLRLLGPVTQENLVGAFQNGLQLATIVVCVGAANSLANPKRLLRSVPPALYEVGTALVVAVSMLPQLAESAARVRAAQQLREGDERRVGRLKRFLVPVLEDALERSLALAAGMDARGYGRAGAATPAQRRTTGILMLTGLGGVCVGTYAVLDRTAPRLLATPLLIAGTAVAALGLLTAGRRVERSRYRPDRWRWPDVAVALTGVAVAVVGSVVAQRDLLVAFPGPLSMPPVTVTALAGVLLGAVAGVVSPPPREAVG